MLDSLHRATIAYYLEHSRRPRVADFMAARKPIQPIEKRLETAVIDDGYPALARASSQRFQIPLATSRPRMQERTKPRCGVSSKSAVIPATKTNKNGTAIKLNPKPG